MEDVTNKWLPYLWGLLREHGSFQARVILFAVLPERYVFGRALKEVAHGIGQWVRSVAVYGTSMILMYTSNLAKLTLIV